MVAGTRRCKWRCPSQQDENKAYLGVLSNIYVLPGAAWSEDFKLVGSTFFFEQNRPATGTQRFHPNAHFQSHSKDTFCHKREIDQKDQMIFF